MLHAGLLPLEGCCVSSLAGLLTITGREMVRPGQLTWTLLASGCVYSAELLTSPALFNFLWLQHEMEINSNIFLNYSILGLFVSVHAS